MRCLSTVVATGCWTTNPTTWAWVMPRTTLPPWRRPWPTTGTTCRRRFTCWPCTACCRPVWEPVTTPPNTWVAPCTCFCGVSTALRVGSALCPPHRTCWPHWTLCCPRLGSHHEQWGVGALAGLGGCGPPSPAGCGVGCADAGLGAKRTRRVAGGGGGVGPPGGAGTHVPAPDRTRRRWRGGVVPHARPQAGPASALAGRLARRRSALEHALRWALVGALVCGCGC